MIRDYFGFVCCHFVTRTPFATGRNADHPVVRIRILVRVSQRLGTMSTGQMTIRPCFLKTFRMIPTPTIRDHVRFFISTNCTYH